MTDWERASDDAVVGRPQVAAFDHCYWDCAVGGDEGEPQMNSAEVGMSRPTSW